MPKKRSTFTPEFKMSVVLESFQTELSLNELAQKYEISLKNLTNWRERFLSNAHLAFEENDVKQTLENLKKENAQLEKQLKEASAEQEFIRKNIKLLKIKS